MAKTKKKLAEKVFNKKANANAKKSNPFEVHINKQKYEILGQKCKNDRGLPGVSRARAIEKRKHTLLPEYNLKNKSNKFLDRRIGENNFSMTEEDRHMARFTAERVKHHSKKSIFNLADDEILTHRGQTLNEIEKFDDPRSDDDDEMDDGRKSSGNLTDNFVGDVHFGGGVLTKTGNDGAKSHKDLIEQLIMESKKRKAEKQKTKEETVELTEKLDSEWKDLLPLVSKIKNTNDDKPEIKQKPDDYDKIMRELKFEARGNPTDRLKSEDEVAKEEKEKLEKLERDRLERMRGIMDKPTTKNEHRSADDLDDNFAYDSGPEETLAYDEDGKLMNADEYIQSMNGNDETSDKDEDKEDGDEDSEDEDSEEGETDDDLSDLKQDESDSDIEQSIVEKPKKNKPSSDETLEKNLKEPKIVKNPSMPEKNLKDSQKIRVETTTKTNEINELNTKEKKRKISETVEESTTTKILKTETVDENEMRDAIINQAKQKEMMEKAQKELPYTYALPDSYEILQSLLTNQPPEYQDVIIERMIKCNHQSLAAENKEKLGRLFVYLLQHLNDVAPEKDNTDVDSMQLCFSVLNSLTPHLYNLTQLNPQNARDSLIEVINEKQSEYKKKLKEYPGVDVLVYLKLISCLFSTSDFRHQVVTPSLVFIGQMLTNCRVKTRYDITYGLFLVTLFLEYTTLSKRYMPAALIYLSGIVHMAIPKTIKLVKIYPPFKPNSAGLVLLKKQTVFNFELKMNAEDFIETDIDESFKLRTLYTVLKFVEEIHENWSSFPSQIEIFEPFSKLLDLIPKQNYPETIQTEIEKVQNIIVESKNYKQLEYIMAEKKRPKALRLYEPSIERVYDGKKYKPMSKEKAEREKLVYKYKKEMKGALREIRRDKSFLGRVKINQQIQSDQERREKVKQIYAEASMQQGELNALDRKKKSK